MRSVSAQSLILAVGLLGVAVTHLRGEEIRFSVREPRAVTYLVPAPTRTAAPAAAGPQWIAARREGSDVDVLLGRQVVVQLEPGVALESVLAPEYHTQPAGNRLWLVETADANAALALTTELLEHPGVTAAHPVRRRLNVGGTKYAPRPDDPLFALQWHLDNRSPITGARTGVDLNIRAAWAVTRGTNVIVGLGDSGFVADHPDLGNSAGAPHYDFAGDRSGEPMSDSNPEHGTACAGLIAAAGDNHLGVVGVALEARLASWSIFGLFDIFGTGSLRDVIVDEAVLAKMFRFENQTVAVQSHSWGSLSLALNGVSLLENDAIEEAVTQGRGGRGVVMVRAGGNEREQLTNSNDDGFVADPRAIAVAAVRQDGRAARYSSPGANLLVGAPSGDPLGETTEDPTAPNLVTTDVPGAGGYNAAADASGDYASGGTGFSGTSASCPQIAGVAALILSANPTLSYRDVQQILVHSARHFDLADPNLMTNGAGFAVSHNVGFGTPDAGLAVTLARRWSNRPPLRTITTPLGNSLRAIPDDSLKLEISGPGAPTALASIRCLPGQGPQFERSSDRLPLIYVGLGNTNIPTDLTGKGALIQRGENFFFDKIERAARAGAAYVVIFNNKIEDPELLVMFATGYTPIPAVMIGKADGEALRDYIVSQPANRGRLSTNPLRTTWTITEALVCEQVGVRIRTTHTSRGDLRITLVSPAGTRSILQTISDDFEAGPDDWTYWTTHCFFESSLGEWRLEVSDQRNLDTGSLNTPQLIIRGTSVIDTDGDGLDDGWERAAFGDLRYGPRDDPDGDGMSNAREQCLNTRADRFDPVIPLEFAAVSPDLVRVTIPVPPGRFLVESSTQVAGPYTSVTQLTNTLPYLDVIAPAVADPQQFFRWHLLP